MAEEKQSGNELDLARARRNGGNGGGGLRKKPRKKPKPRASKRGKAGEAPEKQLAEGIGEGRKFSRKLTDNHKMILEALERAEYLCDIRKKIGVSRHTLEDYVHGDPELEQAYRDGQEDLNDAYEKRLHELSFRDQEFTTNDTGDAVPTVDARVMAANLNGVKFRLERRAASRGYGAKLETNEVGNGMRVPVIVLNEISEESISEADAMIKDADEHALDGIDNVQDLIRG